MVFKPLIGAVTRHIFIKPLVHGYAQSVVAASQSSFASQTALPLVLGNGPHSSGKAYKAFSGSNAGGRADYSTTHGGISNSGSFYSAFHNHSNDDESQHKQLLHRKRLVPSGSVVKEVAEKDGLSRPAGKQRSASMSCVREFSTSAPAELSETTVENQAAAAEPMPEANPVIPQTPPLSAADQQQQQQQQQQVPEVQAITEEAAIADATAASTTPTPQSPAASFNSTPAPEESWTTTSPVEAATPSSAVEDTSSDLSGQTLVNLGSSQTSVQEYVAAMDALKLKGGFAQIRDLFHTMLAKNTEPTTTVFNYLLHAVTQIPMTGKERLATLEGHYDQMVAFKLVPSTYTYSILISAFADGAETDYKTVKTYEAAERRNGGFLMPSERQLLDEARTSASLETAMALFTAGSELNHKFSDEAFNMILLAVAQRNDLQSLVTVLGYMESLAVTPTFEAYGEMIRAFGRDQDISSAVDCYKTASSQIKDLKSKREILQNGLGSQPETSVDVDPLQKLTTLSLLLAQAYVFSGKENEGMQFVEKAIQSGYFLDNESIVNWVGSAMVSSGDLDGALRWAEQTPISKPFHIRLFLNELCGGLADAGRADEALVVFKRLVDIHSCFETSTNGMVAMYLRLGDLDSARAILDLAIQRSSAASVQLNNLSALFSLKSIEADRVDEAIEYYVMGILKSYQLSSSQVNPTPVDFSEGINVILAAIDVHGSFTQLQSLAFMNLYDGLRTAPEVHIARRLLAPFDGVPPEAFTAEHFNLLVLAQSVVAQSHDATAQEFSKLEYMLGYAMENRLPLWNFPAAMVEKREALTPLTPPHNLSLEEQIMQSPFNLQGQWRSAEEYGNSFLTSVQMPQLDVEKLFEDHDPYAESLNLSKSQSLGRYLEDKMHDKGAMLNKARNHVVAVFQALSGTQSHLQPHVVAKALQFLVKDVDGAGAHFSQQGNIINHGRGERDNSKQVQAAMNSIRTVFNAALAPIPFIPESRKVRYAWFIIYDAMISACLQLSCVAEAEEYREQMLRLGASPSANTYGLFIVHLKSQSPSFDEATEAVKIFERTKKENVAPSSFLYNALIGKLSKARRIDDCLMYFSEMRALGIRPTSVTYGTIVNALCRVSDQRFAEELFEEMESMPNYKPRPAPYNSLIQYYIHTKSDQAKGLEYYNRMLEKGITPSSFTYKLVLDAYVSCEPYNLDAAIKLLAQMKSSKHSVQSLHYGSLIYGIGVRQLNVEGARHFYDKIVNEERGLADASIFQAWAETLTANEKMDEVEQLKQDMRRANVAVTPYIVNALINGWSAKGELHKAEVEYSLLAAEGSENLREPSTYEAMAKAYETAGDHDSALTVVNEMAGRMYPAPVLTKVMDVIRAEGKYEATLIQ